MYISIKKAKLYPNRDTKELLDKTFGCCRFVYNTLLFESKRAYELWKEKSLYIKDFPKPNVNYAALCLRLTALKQEYEFLNEVSSVALQQSVKNLAVSYVNFFKKRAKFPKFKNKHDRNAFRIVSDISIRVESGLVYFPKTKHATKFLPRYDVDELFNAVSSYTVIKDKVGDYFINLVTTEELLDSSKGLPSAGIDLGIKTFAVVKSSNGSVEEIPSNRFYVKHQKQRTKLARRLAKKQKGSSNKNKARIKLAKLERKLVNSRKDFLHKASTKLINENQVICLEDLNVSGMLQNPKLAKHIQDCGWSLFTTMLEYKARKYAIPKNIIKIDRWYASSNICSSCNTRREVKLKLSDRSWICSNCNTKHDRDENASINILKQGLLLIQ